MFSLKNGILSIKYDFLHIAEFLYEILFVANIVAIFLFVTVAMVAPIFSVALFVSSVILLIARKNKTIRIHGNFIWYGVFTIYVAFSFIWSEYASFDDFGDVIRMLIILITIASISIFVDSEEKLEKLMSLFILSGMIIALYEFINTPVESWTIGFFGSHSTGSNSNEASFMMFCSELMAFYKAYIKGKKIYYLPIILMIIFILLSSSRKALFLCILGPLFMILLTTEKRGYLFRIIVFITAVIGVLYFVMTNETLYSTLGIRLERLFDFAVNDSGLDNSMNLRAYYIGVARSFFEQSPVIGKGHGSIEHLLDTYAHNNFWQIFSEYGLIGFTIYYSFYAYCIVKLFKGFFIKKNKLCLVFMIFFVLLVTFEVGIVSVKAKYNQIVIALAYTVTYIETTDTERKYRYRDSNLMQTAVSSD